jgi:hypothetical protein
MQNRHAISFTSQMSCNLLALRTTKAGETFNVGIGCGAYLIDGRPLLSSSYAPVSQLQNVFGLLHVGTLTLSTYECASM